MNKHYIFCISGFSGSGKDEFGRRLIEKYNTTKVGLADVAKRHLADLYDFTESQLFGPSAYRNKGDIRYPKDDLKHADVIKVLEECEIQEGDPRFWLSPREALQIYCEKMNDLYLNTWIEKNIRTHIQIAQDKHNRYSPMQGVVRTQAQRIDNEFGIFTCSCDFRHKHEINTIRIKAKTDGFIPVLIRIKRAGLSKPPFDHRSEVEQSTISDDVFDFVVHNDGTNLIQYHNKADEIVHTVVNNFSPKLDVVA